ncbi:TonB-dependent receptor plug domain-containing protein [Aliikangiella maris]|uniref:TonB-dependent receptor n=2 Tax=Aliikangiella maris TaxID=3162458 RepID=A0ABV3MKN1_9GAMM
MLIKKIQVAGLKAAVIAVSLALTPTTVFAQDEEAKDESEGNKVVITGSRLKRNQMEGISPVTIISAEDMIAQGHATAYDVINSLSANSGFSSPESSSLGWSAGTQTVNLRGLGSNRSLVLLDFQRLPVTPKAYLGSDNVVNLGMIPIAAIERIEVVSTGASAIYGSDAMTGVVNVILKRDFDGSQINVSAGDTFEGDLHRFAIDGVKGWSGEGWNITVGASYTDTGGFTGNDRKEYDGIEDIPNPELYSARGLYSNDTEIWSWWHGQIRPTAEQCAMTDGQVLEPNGDYCGHERIGEMSMIQPRQVASVFATSTFELDNDISGRASFFYNQTKRQNTIYWSATPQDVEVWDIAYDANGNPDWDNSTWLNNLWYAKRINPENHNPDIEYEEEMFSFQFGLDGSFNDNWQWGLNTSFARNDSEEVYPVLTQNNWARLYLGFGNPGTPLESVDPSTRWIQYSNYEVFRMDASEMQDLYLPLFGHVGMYENPGDRAEQFFVDSKTLGRSENASISFDVSGEFGELAGGAIGVAAVVEFSQSEISLTNTPQEFADGLVNWFVGLATEGKRDHTGVGIEANLPFTDQLSVSLATRYDDYDDNSQTGSAQTYMLGLEYRPVDELLIRASYSTNFRAPDMHRLFGKRGTQFVGQVQDPWLAINDPANAEILQKINSGNYTDPSEISAANWDFSCVGCTTINSFEHGTGGDLSLEEEEGYTANVGVIYDVTDDWTVQLDIYEIEVQNRIISVSMTDYIDLEAGCRLGFDIYNPSRELDINSPECVSALDHVARDDDGQLAPVTSRAGHINQGFFRSRGLDFATRYRLETEEMGTFNFTFDYNYVDTYQTQYDDASPVIEWRNQDTGLLRNRGKLQTQWVYDAWNVSLSTMYYGSGFKWDGSGRSDALFLTNLYVGNQVTENMSLGLTLNNLTDEGLPKDETWNNFPFGNAGLYSAAIPGREYRVALQYNF